MPTNRDFMALEFGSHGQKHHSELWYMGKQIENLISYLASRWYIDKRITFYAFSSSASQVDRCFTIAQLEGNVGDKMLWPVFMVLTILIWVYATTLWFSHKITCNAYPHAYKYIIDSCRSFNSRTSNLLYSFLPSYTFVRFSSLPTSIIRLMSLINTSLKGVWWWNWILPLTFLVLTLRSLIYCAP